jgi:hypothetical protein
MEKLEAIALAPFPNEKTASAHTKILRIDFPDNNVAKMGAANA